MGIRGIRNGLGNGLRTRVAIGAKYRPFGRRPSGLLFFPLSQRAAFAGKTSMRNHIKRREFISLLGSATAWPIATGAQQGERMRRIGMLLPATADDSEFQARVGAFLQALALLGWTIGRNVR